MTAFDFTLIGIMSISVLIGLWRGAFYEVFSLLGWPLAFVLSKYCAPRLAAMLPVSTEATRTALAYALVFIAALLVWAMLVWLLSRLIKAVGLGLVDGLLGALFGVLRGVLVVLALVWVAGMTHLPEQRFWRDAKFSSAAEEMALLTKLWLPDNIAQRIRYRAQS
jgi:membrane protein required for colicin V production